MNPYIDMFNYQYIQQQAQQHHISQVLEVQKGAKALHDHRSGSFESLDGRHRQDRTELSASSKCGILLHFA